PPLHGPKRVLGEPMGAGAALTLALALHHGRRGGAPALVNSSSLGGTHISVLVQAADQEPEGRA
ncbi:hypothetical protein P8605_17205, partial [Streptomyces sp. T-3]|nr:hypothetical protein [Streptomyces sp. T-3]